MNTRTAKIILLVLGIAIVLFLTGFTVLNKEDEKNKNFNNLNPIKTAVVKVTEVEKERTHIFNYYSKEGKIMLSGNFSINNKLYPGKIIYDANRTLLFRPDPNQAVIFPKNHITYGFLPPDYLSKENNANITILENNTVLKYKIKTPETESIIEISNMKEENIDIDIDMPENTEYIKGEELVINVW